MIYLGRPRLIDVVLKLIAGNNKGSRFLIKSLNRITLFQCQETVIGSLGERMGNRNRSREYLKQRERELTADVDIDRRKVGDRRVQLIEMPWRSEAYSWDVRQRDGMWSLYRGAINTQTFRVQGHERLDAVSAKLQDYFDELCGTVLPLKPYLQRNVGVDGARYQLALFGELDSAIRIEWWSGCPPHPPLWTPLVAIANRMIADFRNTPLVQFGRQSSSRQK